MAGVLNTVFGAPVTWLPQFGAPQVVQSVFREEPIGISDAEGRDVLIEAPTWRVPRDLGVTPRRDDRIRLDDGRVFTVLNQIGTGSPARDAFRVYELELAE